VLCPSVHGQAARTDTAGPGSGRLSAQEPSRELRQRNKARYAFRADACKLLASGLAGSCRPEAGLHVLVLGNSHAIDGYNFLRAAFGDRATNLILFPDLNPCTGAETPEGEAWLAGEPCAGRLDKLRRFVREGGVDVIVYAANRPYAANKTGYLSLLRALRSDAPGLKIVTYGGYLNTRENCLSLVNRFGSSRACAAPRWVSYFAAADMHDVLKARFSRIEDARIDRVALLCDNKALPGCTTETPAGVLMFYDKHHVSLDFSVFSGRLFARQHPAFLERLSDR